MKKIAIAALAGTTVLFTGAAYAQGVDFSKVEIGTIDLGNKTYMLTGQGGNITVAVGTDGIIMVDAQFAPLPRVQQLWSPWPQDPNSYTPNWEVYQVALDKPDNQRVTVLWNGDGRLDTSVPPPLEALNPKPPGGLVVRIPKRGSGAHAASLSVSAVRAVQRSRQHRRCRKLHVQHWGYCLRVS